MENQGKCNNSIIILPYWCMIEAHFVIHLAPTNCLLISSSQVICRPQDGHHRTLTYVEHLWVKYSLRIVLPDQLDGKDSKLSGQYNIPNASNLKIHMVMLDIELVGPWSFKVKQLWISMHMLPMQWRYKVFEHQNTISKNEKNVW